MDASFAGKMFCDLSKFLKDNQYLIEASNGDSINVKLLEQRSEFMNQLNTIRTSMYDMIGHVSNMYNSVEATHSRETQALDTLLNKMRNGTISEQGSQRMQLQPKSYPLEMYSNLRIPPAESGPVKPTDPRRALKNTMRADSLPWTLVQRKPKVGPASPVGTELTKTERVPSKPVLGPPRVDSFAESKYSRVKITEGLAIPAINVPTFADVRQDGNIYYVTGSDHFAFKIAGYMFHGNIGIVYTESREPEKIKDCKYVGTCAKEHCSYYHDPAIFDGSRDKRNFIASSFLYADPHSPYKNLSRSRRFGSREHLDTDINVLTDDERSRFYDQSMHDFLCALLLKNTGKN